MNIDQDLQGEPTFINQGQQVEQAADQAVEQAPVVEARTCPTCGRLGFRGSRGLAIHRRKDRRCQELRQEAQLLPGVETQANSQQEFIIANDVLLDAILVTESQQELPIYIVLLVALRDAIYGFFRRLGRCCLWFLKLLYNLMIFSMGALNIYFVYIYCFENYRPPSLNKATYLISPNFKEEFTII